MARSAFRACSHPSPFCVRRPSSPPQGALGRYGGGAVRKTDVIVTLQVRSLGAPRLPVSYSVAHSSSHSVFVLRLEALRRHVATRHSGLVQLARHTALNRRDPGPNPGPATAATLIGRGHAQGVPAPARGRLKTEELNDVERRVRLPTPPSPASTAHPILDDADAGTGSAAGHAPD